MIIEATDKIFDTEINQLGTVIVDLWASWCGPCKAMAPAFEQVAQEYEGRARFLKVNIDETQVASQFGVRGIPTLIAFKDGQRVATLVGNQTKADLTKFVATVL